MSHDDLDAILARHDLTTMQRVAVKTLIHEEQSRLQNGDMQAAGLLLDRRLQDVGVRTPLARLEIIRAIAAAQHAPRVAVDLHATAKHHFTIGDLQAAGVIDFDAAYIADQRRWGSYAGMAAVRGNLSPHLHRVLCVLPDGATLDEPALGYLLDQAGMDDPTQRMALKTEAAAKGILRTS